MSQIIVNNATFDEGAAYGVILTKDGEKDVGYGAGPWTPQNALLPGINMGLSVADRNSKTCVNLPGSQIINYIVSGVVEKWKENGWRKLNNSKVEAQKEWKTLLNLTKQHKNIHWVRESDHELMEWARKCALCAVAQIDIHNLRPTEDIETVSKDKAGQFWMVAKDAGHTDQSARKLLSEFGVISAKDLPKSEFESALERAESETLVSKYKETLN